MTRIALVRHGETIWHAENRYAGVSDVPLTARGEAQAERLGRWAAGAGLDALWVSPLSRARATVAPAERATGLAARADERLRELAIGDAEGLTPAEMDERFPDVRERFRRDPVAHHLPGGEDPVAAAGRAVACLGEIAATHAGGRVLVVAHTTLIRLALCELLGLPLPDYRRRFPAVHNTAISEIGLEDGRASLLALNIPLDAEP